MTDNKARRSMTERRRDEPFAAGGTALLLVDMQRAWLEPQGEATPFHADIAARVIPNQQRLLTAARASGIEVVHTIIPSLTADGRDRSPDPKLSSIPLAPGHPLAHPAPAPPPRPHETPPPTTS